MIGYLVILVLVCFLVIGYKIYDRRERAKTFVATARSTTDRKEVIRLFNLTQGFGYPRAGRDALAIRCLELSKGHRDVLGVLLQDGLGKEVYVAGIKLLLDKEEELNMRTEHFIRPYNLAKRLGLTALSVALLARLRKDVPSYPK